MSVLREANDLFDTWIGDSVDEEAQRIGLGPAPRDELDQQINVTLWAELPARRRAEQGKTRDTVSAAELSKPFAVNGPEHAAHLSVAIRRGSCVLDGTRIQVGWQVTSDQRLLIPGSVPLRH